MFKAISTSTQWMWSVEWRWVRRKANNLITTGYIAYTLVFKFWQSSEFPFYNPSLASHSILPDLRLFLGWARKKFAWQYWLKSLDLHKLRATTLAVTPVSKDCYAKSSNIWWWVCCPVLFTRQRSKTSKERKGTCDGSKSRNIIYYFLN